MKDEIEQSKFNDDKELLAAYNALEREFTKRCQLIKELQAKLDAVTAQAPPQELPVDDAGDAEGSAGAVQTPFDAPPPPQPPTERDVLEYVAERAGELAELLSQIPEIADACIARYKQRILGCRTASSPRGAAVITPARRPKTLDEAKRLVDELLSE